MLPPAISWPTRTDHFTPRVQFSLPYNPSQLETRANYPRNLQDIPFLSSNCKEDRGSLTCINAGTWSRKSNGGIVFRVNTHAITYNTTFLSLSLSLFGTLKMWKNAGVSPPILNVAQSLLFVKSVSYVLALFPFFSASQCVRGSETKGRRTVK